MLAMMTLEEIEMAEAALASSENSPEQDAEMQLKILVSLVALDDLDHNAGLQNA